MKMMFAPVMKLRCNSSDRLHSQFVIRQQSIHLREKSIAGPTERSRASPPAKLEEGLALFDEDDVCAGMLSFAAAVQTGCIHSSLSGSEASIFVRKALRVRPRDRVTAACRLRKLAGKDLRFSMKMMFAPVYGASLQPV